MPAAPTFVPRNAATGTPDYAAAGTPSLDVSAPVVPTPSSNPTGDALVNSNVAAAAKLGITIPGVGGGNGLTSSSGTARTDESNLGAAITAQSAPTYLGPTNNTSYLDKYQNLLDSNFDSGNSSINGTYDSTESALKDTQAQETGSTSAQVARAGGYLGYSGSGAGVLQNLVVKHQTELNDLEAKRQAALQAAREGYATQSYQIAQDRLTEANNYEKEANAAKQKFFDDTNTYLANQKKGTDQTAISKAMSDGATSAEAIFNKLNGTVSMADISDFLKSAATTSGGFAFSAAELPKVLGTGLSLQDVQSAESYINQHGYTADFRATLTPSQRSAFDSVFNPKTGTASAGQTVKDGNLIYTPQDYAEDSKVLESARGSDGWTDPTKYFQLFQSWMGNGGSVAGFQKEYPPADYVNPENTWLPAYLMPKTAAAAGSTPTFTSANVP